MKFFISGDMYGWVPPVGMGVVDIDDVAAAHTLAMVTPEASGRCVGYLYYAHHLSHCYVAGSTS
jgi:hypothetical protein